MESISFEGFVDFLALELERDPAELCAALDASSSAQDKLMDQVEGSSLSGVNIVLAEPIVLKEGEAPLLAAGAKLEGKYLRTLMKRQMADLGVPLGPICLEPNDSLIGHYRELTSQRSATVLDGARNNGPSAKLVSQLLQQCSYSTTVDACLDQLLPALTELDAFLFPLLQIVSNPTNKTTLAAGFDAARVATAVLGEYKRFTDAELRQEAFLELAKAAVLQDLSLMLEPDTERAEHAARSRKLLLDFDFGMGVAAIVSDHHTTKTAGDQPILQSKKNLPETSRILVVANTFLGMMGGQNSGDGFEAMKSLNHLVAGGYLDKQAVDILSRLFLPKVKALILDRAHRIANHCPRGASEPVLWPITGDKVPSVFICGRTDCEQISEQITLIAQKIPFVLDGEEIATISKGNYYICPFLSGHLKELYQLINQRNRSAGKA